MVSLRAEDKPNQKGKKCKKLKPELEAGSSKENKSVREMPKSALVRGK